MLLLAAKFRSPQKNHSRKWGTAVWFAARTFPRRAFDKLTSNPHTTVSVIHASCAWKSSQIKPTLLPISVQSIMGNVSPVMYVQTLFLKTVMWNDITTRFSWSNVTSVVCALKITVHYITSDLIIKKSMLMIRS